MDRNEFFDQLHQQLAEKHNLTILQVSIVRGFSGRTPKTRKEIAEWAALKLSQPHKANAQSKVGRRTHGKLYYQDILNFVASCSSEVWNDITQKTEFDKG